MLRLTTVLLLLLALPGCVVTLHGQQTSAGGQSATTTGSSVQGSTRLGNARLGGSFGAPPPVQGFGGQVTLSRGGSAALVVSVAIVAAIEEWSAWLRGRAAPHIERLPEERIISRTCSCYGWQPELTAAPATQ
jgi:hypothetical protein